MLLYIMLAYLMVFAALSNAVSLYNASFLPLIYTNALCFHALCWYLTHSLFISCIVCIIHSAFNLSAFRNSMFTSFFVFLMKGLCALWRNGT